MSCRIRPLRPPSGRRSCVAERTEKAMPAGFRFHVGKHVVSACSVRDSISRVVLSPFATIMHSHTVVVGWRTNRAQPFSSRLRIIVGRARDSLTPIAVVAQSRTAVIGSRTDRIRAVSDRARVIFDRARAEFKPRVAAMQLRTAAIDRARNVYGLCRIARGSYQVGCAPYSVRLLPYYSRTRT